MGDLDQAADVFEERVWRNPDAATLFLPLGSVLAHLGRREEARQMLVKFQPVGDQKGLGNLPSGAIPSRLIGIMNTRTAGASV